MILGIKGYFCKQYRRSQRKTWYRTWAQNFHSAKDLAETILDFVQLRLCLEKTIADLVSSASFCAFSLSFAIISQADHFVQKSQRARLLILTFQTTTLTIAHNDTKSPDTSGCPGSIFCIYCYAIFLIECRKNGFNRSHVCFLRGILIAASFAH